MTREMRSWLIPFRKQTMFPFPSYLSNQSGGQEHISLIFCCSRFCIHCPSNADSK